jgi:hypothetical protein
VADARPDPTAARELVVHARLRDRQCIAAAGWSHADLEASRRSRPLTVELASFTGFHVVDLHLAGRQCDRGFAGNRGLAEALREQAHRTEATCMGHDAESVRSPAILVT